MSSKVVLILLLTASIGFQCSAQSGKVQKNEKSTQKIWGNEMYDPIEVMPRFPGCEDKGLNKRGLEKCAKDTFMAYVYDKLIYPEKAKSNQIEGKVLIQFFITEEGKMTDLKVIRNIGFGCGEASIKIFEKMQNEITWIPGTQRGIPVQVQYTMPVKFELPK